jgi:predicted nicotinamide N-methyase
MNPDPPLGSEATERLNRLQVLCPMRYRDYVFDEEPIRIWTACDIDPLLDRLLSKDDSHPDVKDERMPYLPQLAPTPIKMAETIQQSKETHPKGPWLEMGCGPGLAGVMAAKAGRSGYFTDYMPEALWLAEVNAYQNGCMDRTDFKLLDWRSPDMDQTFPWILAGDVAYETRNFVPLLDSFERLLAPDGEIWLGEPGRTIAGEFFDQLTKRGWKRLTIGTSKGVSVYRLTRTT